MNDVLTSSLLVLLALLAAGGLLQWRLLRRRRRQQRLRREGWRLVHELKAYSAWIESLRGEPSPSAEPEELTSAQALRNARAIAQAWFPELGQVMLRLLRTDSLLMAHLWQQKLLRLSEPSEWLPYQRDPGYWQIRDGQEDLIEEIIARCQVLTGERGQPWHGTDLDSDFLGPMSALPTGPVR
ncbi:hypothetical protein [Ramlibacter sp.]|uniref:hypothetical protein n=1 Tax=Ramlibacter sp. TaxID=1917967 RepID=UPI002C8DEC14|nr:hypothetical protein [Ramlibacter sp.]HWI83287.1 hypothetical protein [Ramlibacter sp.]